MVSSSLFDQVFQVDLRRAIAKQPDVARLLRPNGSQGLLGALVRDAVSARRIAGKIKLARVIGQDH
jgi:hypothetical protein